MFYRANNCLIFFKVCVYLRFKKAIMWYIHTKAISFNNFKPHIILVQDCDIFQHFALATKLSINYLGA